MMTSRTFRPWLLAAALLTLLAACDDGAPVPGAAAGGEMPPVAVSTVTARAEAIPVVNELPGRIAPTSMAEVRPRVSGLIIERVFEQGSLVQAGDVLYRIDPAPFRVQVESAEATLRRAEAAQVQARQQADRQRELRERNVASAQQLDNAVAVLAQADADVAAARAGLAAAQLDLQYTEVKAPISGRIGRALITEGALVSPSSNEVLATIRQLDPVYADFTQSANQLMQLRRALESGALKAAGPDGAAVRLLFDDGSAYSHGGRLLFSEATVDETTGQVTLRCEFPNPDNVLLPGMYVRVVIEQATRPNAIAVPQQAVQRDTAGRAQLYIVGDGGVVELRSVTAGDVTGDRWVIEEGLRPGELVVVEGFQKIRPGAKVAPQPWQRGEQTTAAAEVQ
jgi:membrane fusion protein (multidrug efflux system)